MLGHKRIPSREGGVEIVVSELATRMVVFGHSVTCYNRKGHHISGSEFDTAQSDTYRGVRLKNVFTLNKKGLAAMTASCSAAIRAAFGRYDVVHFHAEGPCAMLWLPKLFGKRCIATVHGLDHKRAKWGKFASWYIRAGEKCAVRFADEIIVLSEGVQKYFLETYQRKTVLIPNGVTAPIRVEADDIERRYGLQKDGYILFLGRLVPEKGVHDLISAYKGLSADRKLVIAGGSSDSSDYMQSLIALADGDPNIIFTGFVQGRLLEELYSNAYVYVLPSSLEGMPLSLLEAMSYGNCCLVSDIPECTDVIGNCGLSFETGNASDLREKLQYLCDYPDAVHRFRSCAADHVLAKYNWDDVTEKTLQIYGAFTDAADSEERIHEGSAHK